MLQKPLHDRLMLLVQDKLYTKSIWQIADSIMLTGMGFFFWMVITHLYTVTQVGIASTMIASIELLVMLSLLGFDIALLHYLPRSKDQSRLLNTAFSLTILVACASGLVFLLLRQWFIPSPAILSTSTGWLTFLVFLLFNLFSNLFAAIFIARDRMRSLFAKDMTFSLAKLALPFLFVGLGAFGILSSWMVAAGIASALSLFILKIHIRPAIHRDIITRVFRFGLANYVANFLARGPKWILPLLIASIIDPAHTAYFYVAWTLAGVLFMIPVSVSKTLLSAGKLHTFELERQVQKALLFTFLLLIPAVILMLIFADTFLLLFGKAYSVEATRLLQLVSLASIPFAINTIAIAVHNIQKRIWTVLLINGAIAIGFVGFSTIFLSSSFLALGYSFILVHGIVAIFSILGWRRETGGALANARNALKQGLLSLRGGSA
ncbi:MAG: oligosaccharide flippase family protein [DPANN group archaeon]|nr:oligosaccharide flippase family protein [DPANN group archaeon]